MDKMTKILASTVFGTMVCTTLMVGLAQAQTAQGGAITAGVSYSNNYGATSFISVEGRDILQSGVSARVAYRGGPEGHGGDVHIEKTFKLADSGLGQNPALRVAVYGKTSDWDFVPYNEETYGLSLAYAADLSTRVSWEGKVFWHHDELSNLDASVSPLIAADAGSSSVLGAEIALRWSNRAQTGLFDVGTDLSFGVASTLSGSSRRAWSSATVAMDTTHKLVGSSVVNFSFGAGVIGGHDNNGYVNILDRTFSGDGSLRGFSWGAAGPTDAATGQALGGTRYLNASVEARIPLRRQGLSAGVFFDAGSVWDLPGISGVDDDMHIRTSAGIVLHWETRFGQLEAAFAEPLNTRTGDDTQRFSLSMNAVF